MKFGDITNHLSGKQLQTNEEPDSLFTANKQLLTEDQLGSIAGGKVIGDSEERHCPRCGRCIKGVYCNACKVSSR